MTTSLSKIISPGLYDVHRAIRQGGVNEVVLPGGRGSTKSSFASVELILMLLRHPDCHAVILRKVANTLRNSVYEQIAWAIAELGLESRFELTVSPMRAIYKPTGQRIMFFGLDDPGKIKSIKVPFGYVGLVWFEELGQYSGPEEIRNVEQSLFRGGSFSFAFKSFNPPAMARNWANRYALEQRPREAGLPIGLPQRSAPLAGASILGGCRAPAGHKRNRIPPRVSGRGGGQRNAGL